MIAFKRVFATIATQDLERARRFYEEVLGLSVAQALTEGVLYQVGDARLYLYPSESAGTAAHTVASFEVEDIHAVLTELRARGVDFEEYDMPGLQTVNGIAELDGEYAAWFRDPDGNYLAIGQLK